MMVLIAERVVVPPLLFFARGTALLDIGFALIMGSKGYIGAAVRNHDECPDADDTNLQHDLVCRPCGGDPMTLDRVGLGVSVARPGADTCTSNRNDGTPLKSLAVPIATMILSVVMTDMHAGGSVVR